MHLDFMLSEFKLSELSEVVGNYEKLKFQDQMVIQKLKERLQQLDVENTALSQHSPTTEIPDNNRQTVNELESLREQIHKLKTALKYAVENTSLPKEGGERRYELVRWVVGYWGVKLGGKDGWMDRRRGRWM